MLVSDSGMQEIRCSCGHKYCFTCVEDWHGPVSCGMLKKWAKKCEDDSETVNWINANTKECPKCNNPIEKNGGCNHMTCRQAFNHLSIVLKSFPLHALLWYMLCALRQLVKMGPNITGNEVLAIQHKT